MRLGPSRIWTIHLASCQELLANLRSCTKRWPKRFTAFATELLHDLQEGRVRTLVNRSHHRKENSLLSNEPDLAPILSQDGETVSLVDVMPAPQPGEEERHIQRLQRQFTEFPSHFCTIFRG